MIPDYEVQEMENMRSEVVFVMRESKCIPEIKVCTLVEE